MTRSDIGIERVLDSARRYTGAVVFYHDQVAEMLGVSTSDLKALDSIQRAGPRRASDLMGETGLASASVTALIDRLELKGFVRRTVDSSDRRGVVVEVTERFRREVVPLFDPLGKRMRERLARLNSEELRSVRAFLEDAGSALDGASRTLARAGGRSKR